MQNFLFTLLLLFPAPALSAQEKISTLPNQLTNHQTRAVVVGISDYQDAEIPDLQYAHKDAEAFANWLHSPAGGNVPADNIRLLLNEKATAAQFTAAIDWLIEQTTAGDRAVIYFSGHGDMEAKLLNQLGFLLLWDSPAHAYLAGALPVDILKQVVTTLSVEKKANVLVVADACRAGKLAGSNVVGTQLTNANLAKQFANEQKILSCQADEYSIEGRQWGGGRGAFSWHLVNGLYGLADLNGDNQIILMEIGRFLEDRVTPEVQPLSQVPLTVGDKTEVIGRVDEIALANLKKGKEFPLANFSGVEQRGLVQEVLEKANASVVELFQAFQLALKEKRLLEPAGNCAEEYYHRLLKEPGIGPLHTYLRRNYAAALQDDAQQVMNEWLKTDETPALLANETSKQARLPIKIFTEKVRAFPRYLDRAAELLGTKHYMYAALKARKYFFEGYLLTNSNRNPDAALGERALALFNQSLQWQAEQPQVYWQMAHVFGYNMLQPDSMQHYTRRATQVHPSWAKLSADAASALIYKYKLLEQAKPFLEHASSLDSNSVRAPWGVYYLYQGKNAEAEQQFKKAVALDSTYVAAWNNLGFFYSKTRRYAEAEQAFIKAIALDSTESGPWNNLGFVYQNTRRNAEAEPVLKKAIALDSTIAHAWNNLGVTYKNTRRYAEAEPVLKKALTLDSTNYHAWNNLGLVYQNIRRYAEAERAFIKAVALDSTYADAWNSLGFVYQNTRRYAEAERAYSKVVALDSTYAPAWYNLGSVYNNTRRYAEAERALIKAVALDSTIAPGWNNLGMLYNNTRRYAEAELVLKKAIALDSTYFAAWNNLGLVHLNTRCYAEAESVLKKAIALDLTLANPHKHLGMVYFKTNQLEKARNYFHKARELNPNYSAALLGLAYIFTFEGNIGEALNYVEQAIPKGSTFEQLATDEDLAPLRALPEWKALMKKYFPDQAKD